jgi:hypothetical protein
MQKVYNIDSCRMYRRIDYCGPLTLAYTVKAQLGINSLDYLTEVSETEAKFLTLTPRECTLNLSTMAPKN